MWDNGDRKIAARGSENRKLAAHGSGDRAKKEKPTRSERVTHRGISPDMRKLGYLHLLK